MMMAYGQKSRKRTFGSTNLLMPHKILLYNIWHRPSDVIFYVEYKLMPPNKKKIVYIYPTTFVI